METKKCPRCEAELELTGNFNLHKKEGYQPWCRDCNKKYSREYFAKNRVEHNKKVSISKERKFPRCTECGVDKEPIDFYRRRGQFKGISQRVCTLCAEENYDKLIERSLEAKKASVKAAYLRDFLPENHAKLVLRYSQRSDVKKSRGNDLDLDFVTQKLSSPCTYCGREGVKMSLDRIDNSLGHLKSNVNCSCRRCNLIRKDMPYQAWVRFIPILREITQENLFGSWHIGPKKASQYFENLAR